MAEYAELIKALRLCQFGECGCGKCDYKELKGDWCTEDNHPEFFDCDDKLKLDAADAIEELQQKWFKSETDATNLTGKLAQAEADIDRLNLEIDKRIATEIELSKSLDAANHQLKMYSMCPFDDEEDY